MPTVVLTRTPADNQPLRRRLGALGFGVVEIPTATLVPTGEDVERPEFSAKSRSWDVVALTSYNAVEALADLSRLDVLHDAQAIVTVGERTRQAVVQAGAAVAHVADPSNGTELARWICAHFPPKTRVLCPRAEHARPELVDGLRAGGLVPMPMTCYRNEVPPAPEPAVLQHALGADLVYFAAPSAGERLHGWAPGFATLPWVAIGPTTAAAIEAQHGHAPIAVAQSPRLDDVVEAILHAARKLGREEQKR